MTSITIEYVSGRLHIVYNLTINLKTYENLPKRNCSMVELPLMLNYPNLDSPRLYVEILQKRRKSKKTQK